MKDLNKVEQLSYFTVMQMCDTAQQEVAVADNVTVSIGRSVNYPEYSVPTTHCYVICIKGNLVYAIEPSLDRLIYFINRANSLSLY